jgi:hypothetical protein
MKKERMEPIELTPMFSSKTATGKCLKCAAGEKYEDYLRRLLMNSR